MELIHLLKSIIFWRFFNVLKKNPNGPKLTENEGLLINYNPISVFFYSTELVNRITGSPRHRTWAFFLWCFRTTYRYQFSKEHKTLVVENQSASGSQNFVVSIKPIKKVWWTHVKTTGVLLDVTRKCSN